MSNMFKSERRPRQYPTGDRDRDRDRGDRNRPHNIDFRGFNEKKKVEVKLTEADFPELVESVKASEKEECKLNFKDAYMKESVYEAEEDGPPPAGWTRYRVKDGIVIVDGEIPKREEEDYTAEEYHYDATQIFRRLINGWNDYKNKYNELHGEEEYERIHSMPNYESFFDEEYDDY